MRTIIGQDEEGPQKRVSSVYHSLAPLERTGAQLKMLEDVVKTASEFVFDNMSATEGSQPVSAARSAALNTLGLALSQIDTILDDQPRWSREDSEAEKEVKSMMKAETERSKSAARFYLQASRPFVLLRAQLFRTASGKLLATNATESVHAFGNTAAEAMDAFDEAVYNQQHLPQAPPNEPPPPPPSPPPAPLKKKRTPPKKS